MLVGTEHGTDLYSDPIVDIKCSRGIQHLKQMCSLSSVSTGSTKKWDGVARYSSSLPLSHALQVNLLVIISDNIKSRRHDGQCPLKMLAIQLLEENEQHNSYKHCSDSVS